MLTSKNLTVRKRGDMCWITFPKLEACGAVNHAFSTRMGGISKGFRGSMNLGITNGDDIDVVRENYRRICFVAGIDSSRLVVARQTHTANVRIVSPEDVGKGITIPRDYDDVDGLITDMPGVGLVTLFADCVPLLFCDPVKKVIAASHSGWRGTAQEIGAVTVKKMHDTFGCRLEDIIAGIGPSIGPCCYEVDAPVYERFSDIEKIDASAFMKQTRDGHYMLNLWEANRLILIKAGITPEHIDTNDICTCCNGEYLHSHRATKGNRGSLGAIIALKDN